MNILAKSYGTAAILCAAIVSIPAFANAQVSENLVRGAVASQSSTGWGGVAKRAIDGNPNANFQKKSTSHTAQNDKMPWWEVDLRTVNTISHIRIFNRTDCCAERLMGAKIMLSTTPIAKPNGLATKGMHVIDITDKKRVYDLKIDGKKARFVRIQRANGGFIHLSEVQIFGISSRTQTGALKVRDEISEALNIFEKSKSIRDGILTSPKYAKARDAGKLGKKLPEIKKYVGRLDTRIKKAQDDLKRMTAERDKMSNEHKKLSAQYKKSGGAAVAKTLAGYEKSLRQRFPDLRKTKNSYYQNYRKEIQRGEAVEDKAIAKLQKSLADHNKKYGLK